MLNSSPSTDPNWIKNNSLLTDNFKSTYKQILDEALKNDPELGLDFDPIFDAQDFPDSGFVFVNCDSENGYVTVRGKDWPAFTLVLKVIQKGDNSLVEGSGIINIPIAHRVKR